MFSRMAAEFGPQVAVDRAGQRVTYANLEAESNRLANFLLEGGAGKGTMVGLLADNLVQIITGILGVLKAGAVFVPLDPTLPDERLRMMSEHVGPHWFVTEARHLEKLERLAKESARVVCLDESYDAYRQTQRPGVASDPDAPCSIYFTSGSTGKPKAILGRLKAIDHFMRWEIETVGAGPGTRVSQLASPSSDGFLKDAFVPLCSGGVVCAPESHDVVLDARRLAEWLDVEQIEVLHCVPSVFRTLLDEGLNSRSFEAMKYVVLTGESLSPADVKRWMDVFGERIKLLNIYGTTETSLSKLAYEVKAEDVERPSIPIGKPIRGSAVMIMDGAAKPCRQGTVGEIYIRTPYRSFGYYGDAELTNQVFIQNPFTKDPNDLIHRTGDYGRLLEDGNLEHLGRRGQQVQDNRGVVSSIEPVSRNGNLPPSFGQQRLWFQEQFARGTTTFHIDLGMRLKGPLNAAALEQTFNEISRRHENLRTTFPVVGGELVQIIHAPARLSIPTINLANLSEANREGIEKQVMVALGRPFDLEGGPLVRLAVIRHSDREHTVLCKLHHIISDGWSRGILIREVASLYEAFGRGEPSPLPDLKVQYADFAAWQRQQLQGETLERELDFWKEQLSGAPQLLDLPTDRPRSQTQTYRGAEEPFLLSPELLQQLKALSQQRGTTMFMLLLAAFQTLLHRYTAQEDIVVGTTIANRDRLEIEPLIGFFVNMLALRADCSGNPLFSELLDQVRETTLKAYAHQGTPFEKLIQELQVKRNTGYSSLFQAVFTFQNQPTLIDFTLSGLTQTTSPKELTTLEFDLLLDMHESSKGLHGGIQYNPDLFDRTTIVRMVNHFRNLLEAIATDPEQRLTEMPMLSGDEAREQVAFNETQTPYPQDVCIHELFETQAAATPDAVAAVFRGDLLSYAELDRRANQLARHLRAEGVKPGRLVAICLEHSLEELIALWGVLKAGAGYVALDPEHPAQRIAFVLADANVATVLTQERLVDSLSFPGYRSICLDRDWDIISQQSDQPNDVEVSPDSLAYVIYTSGSTGEPKGVCISHHSLINYVWWAKDQYLRNDTLAFALYSSFSFDLTVTSIYVPLITGNKVAIFRREAKEALLEELMADDQIGVCKLTPSHLTLIKDNDNRQSGVKCLIVGGESLGTELARQVYESFGEVEIFNEYGPTEATVGCMIYKYDVLNDTRTSVPIGRPAANVHIYALDRWLKPVPTNVTGELFISGPGLAQGYLKRPALTADRFIPDPFSPGERMYRTGDLCRRLSSGNLEYLGRQDEQVKFHGLRVELNEIRGALKKHPQIRDSAVVISKDKNGHDQMVAYYVSRQSLEVAQLRDFLSNILIAETIPNFFVHLDKLPLTLNGKINYEALPSLEEAKQKLPRTYTPPRTPQEVSLAAIWAEVLSVEQVGIEENFFDLGGHSLLAAQIIHRINQTFQIDLPMRVIFDQPTIAGLALSIEEALIEKLEATPELV